MHTCFYQRRLSEVFKAGWGGSGPYSYPKARASAPVPVGTTAPLAQGGAQDEVMLQRKLLRKRSHSGVRKWVLLSIDNGLKNRKQRSGVDSQFSQRQRDSSDLPRGSAQRPPLLSIFVNGLENG